MVRPAHDRAADVRLARCLGGNRRRPHRPAVRPGAQLARRGLAPRGLARATLIKGIQTVDDARLVADAGADAVVISNHGGRQFDRAPVPLEHLPGIVKAVGDRVEVYVDGGIMNGGDVVAAVGLGARAPPGRAGLPLRPDGRRRPGSSALAEILSGEVRRTMALLGITQLSELTGDYVRFRGSA